MDEKLFKIVGEATPLVSIDILIKYENRILLGKRIKCNVKKGSPVKWNLIS